MTWWKIAIAWWLVGALWQTWTMIRLRQRYGGFATELVTRAVLGRLWLLKIVIASFLWPIGMVIVYRQRNKPYEVNAEQVLRLVNAAKHLQTHCPDCGEPLVDGLHEGVAEKRPPS